MFGGIYFGEMYYAGALALVFPPPPPPQVVIIPCVQGLPKSIGTTTGSSRVGNVGVTSKISTMVDIGTRASSSGLRAIGVFKPGCP